MEETLFNLSLVLARDQDEGEGETQRKCRREREERESTCSHMQSEAHHPYHLTLIRRFHTGSKSNSNPWL